MLAHPPPPTVPTVTLPSQPGTEKKTEIEHTIPPHIAQYQSKYV